MTPTPADDDYSSLCVRLASLQKEAGAFLGRYLRECSNVSMDIAEDFAREANEVSDRMKAWRLSNGYEA